MTTPDKIEAGDLVTLLPGVPHRRQFRQFLKLIDYHCLVVKTWDVREQEIRKEWARNQADRMQLQLQQFPTDGLTNRLRSEKAKFIKGCVDHPHSKWSQALGRFVQILGPDGEIHPVDVRHLRIVQRADGEDKGSV